MINEIAGHEGASDVLTEVNNLSPPNDY